MHLRRGGSEEPKTGVKYGVKSGWSCCSAAVLLPMRVLIRGALRALLLL